MTPGTPAEGEGRGLEAEARIAIVGSVAVATSLVGVLVLAAEPRRNWNQWLAFFLLLVAGNYAAQTWQGLLLWEVARGNLDPLQGDAQVRLLRSIGYAFSAFDPAVLAYFASIFPRRTALAERPWGLLLLGAPAVGFVALEAGARSLSDPPGFFDPVRLAFYGYLTACYLFAAWRLLANYASEASSVMAQQARWVTAAVLIAALSRVALVLDDVSGDVEPVWGPLYTSTSAFNASGATLAFRLGVLWGLFAAARWWVQRCVPDGARREEGRAMLRVVGGVFAVFTCIWLSTRMVALLFYGGVWQADGALATAGLIDLLSYPVRWFAFSVAMTYGIVRYQVFSVDRRATTVAGVGAGCATAFFVVGVGAATLGPWAGGALAVAVLVAAFAVQTFPQGGGSPDGAGDYLHERGLEVYHAMLAARFAEGMSPSGERELVEARARLRITEREHETLLAIAQAEEGRAAPGPLMLGRYAVVRRLGTGGYASVYLALDRQHHRLVVLKKLEDRWVGSRAALEAALREVEVARRLSHAHVVTIHDMIRLDDGAVVVMEYLEGGSLRDLVAREGTVQSDWVAAILRDCLRGLVAVHEAGVVHGDLKPENLLLTREGRVKLADFGAARASNAGRTLVRGRGEGPGPATLRYMAPEQATGGRAAPASDLYALGAVGFELLTGAPLIEAEAHYDIVRRIVDGPANPRLGKLPGPWAAFLARATARDPGRRFRSAAEMLGALDLLEDRAAVGDAAVGVPRLRRWMQGV